MERERFCSEYPRTKKKTEEEEERPTTHKIHVENEERNIHAILPFSMGSVRWILSSYRGPHMHNIKSRAIDNVLKQTYCYPFYDVNNLLYDTCPAQNTVVIFILVSGN